MRNYLFLLTVSVLMVGAAMQPAYAYLDPGTGSILLQAVIGSIAAGMVVGRAYLARIKSWFARSGADGSRSSSDR